MLLQLEVTESMVDAECSQGDRVLDAIHSRGIRLAIDDFGTGYSSMSLMKQFPIDTIKIDRSFVRDLPQDAEDQAIAQAIISMGKALGMTVVAEGVETTEQEAFLRITPAMKCRGSCSANRLPRTIGRPVAALASPRLTAPFNPLDTPTPGNPGGAFKAEESLQPSRLTRRRLTQS